jgi:hypothetical protein
MSWSRTATVRPGGGKAITIKTRADHGSLSELEVANVQAAVACAREVLPAVLSQLASPRAGTKAGRNARLARYFLTDPAGPSLQDLGTIYAKLELVMNGINAKVNVKVAPNDEDFGYVRVHAGPLGVLRGMFSRRHNLGRCEGRRVSFGDIHLDQGMLDDPVRTLIVFIHEASHKYAGTYDHDDRGFLKDNGTEFRAPGLTKQEALNNADSYGWFCAAEYYEASSFAAK